MIEEITNVLNDESLTTIEERVSKISGIIGTNTIPKEKYDNLNTQFKEEKGKVSALASEFEDFKKSKMTEDEKAQADIEALNSEKKQVAIERSSLAVEKILLQNGIEITEDNADLKNTLNNIISEDMDKSVALANSFVALIKQTKDTTEKETKTNILKDTPTPIVGTQPSISEVDELEKQLKEAIARRDQVAQISLSRQLQEARAKQTNI